MSREFKLLFAGPMGAGKTTAITAISDRPPIATEAANSDHAQSAKADTTVALDYGEVALGDGPPLRLYGLPGQQRFDFMWTIVAENALGVVVLLDNRRPSPLEDLACYVEAFADLVDRAALVVGLGRAAEGRASVQALGDWLAARGTPAPVFSVDVRRREDVLLLLDALLQQIEMQTLVVSPVAAA